MPRRLTAAPHLPLDELERRHRAARDPVERTHCQIVWLVASGRSCPEVAAAVGYSVDWVRVVRGRSNREGPAGLGDRRHANPGAAPLLDPAQQDELRRALGGPAPVGCGGATNGSTSTASSAPPPGRPGGACCPP